MSIVDQHSRRRSRALSGPSVLPAAPEVPLWRRLFSTPDTLQMDAGAEGELLVAQVRVTLILLLLPIPIVNILLDQTKLPGLIGLGTNLLALGFALLVPYLLHRDFYRPWLGLASSLMDVSLVSIALATFLFLNQPMTAVNSRLLFEVYYVAIGATALRYDARISLAAGAAAFLQYLGIVIYAHLRFDLTDPAIALTGYGTFDWASQISRMVFLVVITLLAVAIVLRSQRLRRQSRSDRLTGLPNRSFFDERVEVELSRARRYGEPVALAMIDVDHFKRYNDTWGHAAGDVALREVAASIEDQIRESDLVVRYGGEEFVALFPSMTAKDALDRVEQIRRAVELHPILIPRRPDQAYVTISVGVAAYGLDGVTAEDLLDRADARLFEAKQAGRNRVVGPAAEGIPRQELPRRRRSDPENEAKVV